MNKDITLEDLGYEKIQDDVNWLIYSFEKVFKICFYKPQQDFKIECLDNILTLLIWKNYKQYITNAKK